MDEQKARLERCLIDYADQKKRAADPNAAILAALKIKERKAANG